MQYLVLIFYHVGPRIKLRVMGLGGKDLYPLRHLVNPYLLIPHRADSSIKEKEKLQTMIIR